jgi:ABC-type branched-subunit amino acid transport system ATPase component
MNKDHGVTFLIVEHNNLFINDLNARVIELVEGVAVDKGHS